MSSKRTREVKYSERSLAGRGVQTFTLTMVWQSQQGTPTWTNVKSVSAEDTVCVNRQYGGPDVRLYMEYMLTAPIQLTIGANPNQFQLFLLQDVPIVGVGIIASVTPGTVKYSPQALDYEVTVQADSTVNASTNVVNGYYFAGVPQTVIPPMLTAIQSSTANKGDYVAATALAPVKVRIDADAGCPSTPRAINLADIAASGLKLPFLVVPSYLAPGLTYSGTGTFMSVDTFPLSLTTCPPLTEMPTIGTISPGLGVVHFALKTSLSGSEIVALPNRVQSKAYPVEWERYLVWIGTLVYSTGVVDMVPLTAAIAKECIFQFNVPTNTRVVNLSGLSGNTIFVAGAGGCIVPEGQETTAYQTNMVPVETADAGQQEANDETVGKRHKIEVEWKHVAS